MSGYADRTHLWRAVPAGGGWFDVTESLRRAGSAIASARFLGDSH
jgi:hypothetical protein